MLWHTIRLLFYRYILKDKFLYVFKIDSSMSFTHHEAFPHVFNTYTCLLMDQKLGLNLKVSVSCLLIGIIMCCIQWPFSFIQMCDQLDTLSCSENYYYCYLMLPDSMTLGKSEDVSQKLCQYHHLRVNIDMFTVDICIEDDF